MTQLWVFSIVLNSLSNAFLVRSTTVTTTMDLFEDSGMGAWLFEDSGMGAWFFVCIYNMLLLIAINNPLLQIFLIHTAVSVNIAIEDRIISSFIPIEFHLHFCSTKFKFLKFLCDKNNFCTDYF